MKRTGKFYRTQAIERKKRLQDMKYSNKLSPAFEQRDKVFIRNMSEKRETGKMRSF